jgi:isovaleryl-CoA dehydrogenase
MSAFGEDLDRLRQSVAGLARDRIAPCAAGIDRTNMFSSDLWLQMGELGLHSITSSRKNGTAQNRSRLFPPLCRHA